MNIGGPEPVVSFLQSCEIGEAEGTEQCGWTEDMAATEKDGKISGKASRALDFEGYELKIGSTYSILHFGIVASLDDVEADEGAFSNPSLGIANIELMEESSAM